MAMIVVSYLFPVVYCIVILVILKIIICPPPPPPKKKKKKKKKTIVIAITDVWNFGVRFCFQEQEQCYLYFFCQFSKSINC